MMNNHSEQAQPDAGTPASFDRSPRTHVQSGGAPSEAGGALRSTSRAAAPERSDPGRDQAMEERRISRIIDGECAADELIEFVEGAGREPRLWHLLLARLHESNALARSLAEVLPETPAVRREASAPRRSLLRAAAWLGWPVAVFALVTASVRGLPVTGGTGSRPAAGEDTPRAVRTDHLAAYLRSPWVMGELQPLLLETEELPDGRIVLRFVRRIEEVAILSREEVPGQDADGLLHRAPAPPVDRQAEDWRPAAAPGGPHGSD